MPSDAKTGRFLSTFTRALGERILKELADGSAPFISLAAERAGVNRNTCHTWVRTGDLGHDEDRAWFAREVRRIRAEWIGRIQREIMEAGREDQYAAKAKTWLLERVDRDLFDITRVHLAKNERTKTKPLEPDPHVISEKSEQEVLDELERPELHGGMH